MLVEDNRKADLTPRDEIPDIWATRGRCPVCATETLKIVHLQGTPDYLVCTHCELSFEVETHGGTIRIKHFPEQLEFAEGDLRYRWVEPSVLRKFLENRRALLQEKASLIPPAALSDEEVWDRMLGLYRLGNQPKTIQFMLIQVGATREQAESAFVRLKQWSEKDAQNKNKRLWLVLGITIALVVSLMAAVVVISSRISSQLQAGKKNPPVANQSILPVQMLKVIPDSVKPEFLKSPPARVEKAGPEKSRCPLLSEEAASLFGGKAEGWKQGSQLGSWQMMSTDVPATIRIPKGMYSAFIDNTTFEFKSADGPATIYNVNFIVITCY